MRLIFGEDAIISAYVTGLTGDRYTDINSTIGVIGSTGRIAGGFVFTNYSGAGIEMSLAGRGCFSKEAFQAVGSYVYGQMGCVRLSCTTRKSNKRVRKLAPKLKMKFEGIARRFYGEEDGIVFSLLRDEAVAFGYYKEETRERTQAA